MRAIQILAFTVILTALFSCEKENTTQFTDSPIVESYLKPGEYMSVNISRQIPFISNVIYSKDDISNLSVSVIFNNQNHILTSLGNGSYIDSSFIVTEGSTYQLRFEFNNKEVYAYTSIPAKPTNFKQSVTSISIPRMGDGSSPPSGGFSMPEPVSLTWDNADKSYYIVVIENIEETLDPIRDFEDDNAPKNMFREAPTTSAGLEIRSMQFQYFGTHRLILYHVLPDYAALYNDNSNSSQSLTNPSTSIQNAYGIFTGLNADTLMLEVTESSK